jgi:hypothetical protein
MASPGHTPSHASPELPRPRTFVAIKNSSDEEPKTEDTVPEPTSRSNEQASRVSTHGHNPLEIEPMTRHSGASVTTFFHGLFQTILAISTLGASITFNYVLSNSRDSNSPTPPPADHFDANTVQLFLAVSWLLFLLDLAFAALGSTLLTFFRRHWEEDWNGVRGETSQVTVQLYAVAASTIMGGLTIAAFVMLCLVVVAYQATIGWIALGFTSFFGLVIVGGIWNQVPWPWRDNNPHLKVPKQVAV